MPAPVPVASLVAPNVDLRADPRLGSCQTLRAARPAPARPTQQACLAGRWVFALLFVLCLATAKPAEAAPALGLQAGAPEFDFKVLLDRDKGVSFPPRAGQAALDVLGSEGLGPRIRSAALFTLGETGTSSGRKLLEPYLKSGYPDERCSAVLAWGQMGSFLGEEDPFLSGLLDDANLEVAGCALFAMYLDTPAPVMDRLAYLVARPSEPLFKAAEHILQWHERGTCSEPGPVAKRLELRWQAARSFGALDGQLWSLTPDRTTIRGQGLFGSGHPAIGGGPLGSAVCATT